MTGVGTLCLLFNVKFCSYLGFSSWKQLPWSSLCFSPFRWERLSGNPPAFPAEAVGGETGFFIFNSPNMKGAAL